MEMAAKITSAGSIILASKESPRRRDRCFWELCAASDCTGFSFHREVYLRLGVVHGVLRALATRQHLGDLGVDDGVALVPARDLGPEPDVLGLPGLAHRRGRHDVWHGRERVLDVLYLGHLVDGVAGRRPPAHGAL